MNRIKLDAIDSTNSFLKEMAQNTSLENYTVVTANQQKNGKGQMGTSWVSEPGKNLLFSVFVAFDDMSVKHQLSINYAVSIAVINTLKRYNLPQLSIKWPNDILSRNKKLCGILVENVMQNNQIKHAVIGIGVNVNQTVFPDFLPDATSMKSILKTPIDLDKLLAELVVELKRNIALIGFQDNDKLKEVYLSFLYKKNIPTMFKNSEDVLFMGKIIGVSSVGKLQIQLDNDTVLEFGIKEVSIA